MRISTAAAFEKSVASLQEQRRKVNDSQEHLDGQKRVLRASDDPVAAARAERARAQLASSEAQKRSIEASRNAMTQTESALGDAGNLLSEAMAALVSAGNGVFSDSERATVAQQLQSLRDQLFSLANREDGAGNYVFGGQGSSAPPFTDTATGVSYNGTTGEQATAGAEALPLTVDGAPAWLKVNDGNGFFKTTNTNSTKAYSDGGRVTDPATFFANTSPPAVSSSSALKYEVKFSDTGGGAMAYTVYKDGTAMGAAQSWSSGSGAKAVQFDGMSFSIGGAPADGDSFEVRLSQPKQSVFDTLDQAIKDLKTPGRTSAQITQTLQNAQAGLSRSADALSALRSRVGEALVHADTAEERNDKAKIQAETIRSNAEDLDLLSAYPEFQQQNTNYEAALKTYSMVQKLSIFNYIGG
jgi:flagellar hook-associated protein 3 FlgL